MLSLRQSIIPLCHRLQSAGKFSRHFSAASAVQTEAVPPPPPPVNENSGPANSLMPFVKVFKRNITSSPKRVRFLLKLVRDAWVPDALAQLKFSPKHKAADVTLLINRAVSILKARHDTLPEELFVKEILVTKGKVQKQVTFMGRGRAGFGYRRWSHIWVKVEKIDFAKKIEEAETSTQKKRWASMELLVNKLKEAPEAYVLQPRPRQRPLWKPRDAYDKPKPPRSR